MSRIEQAKVEVCEYGDPIVTLTGHRSQVVVRAPDGSRYRLSWDDYDEALEINRIGPDHRSDGIAVIPHVTNVIKLKGA